MMPETPSKLALSKKIEDIAARAIEKSKAYQEQASAIQLNLLESYPRIVKLPSCKDSERTIPNIIARSALFGIIKRGPRHYRNMELIAGRGNVEIYYTGKALDQADCTVWMQALAFATILGKDIQVNRSLFLKSLGKTTGKKDYLWLDASLHRLMTSVVTVKTPQGKLEFHLIDTWGRFKDDEQTNEYYLLNISPRVIKMWANSEYTRVEWGKRLAIKRGCDLASWMQLYIRSNSNGDKPHYISLEKLKKWCGLSKRRLDRFRTSMTDAFSELIRIGEIKNALIRNDNMVVFTRNTGKKMSNLGQDYRHLEQYDHKILKNFGENRTNNELIISTLNRDSRTYPHRDSRTSKRRDSRTSKRRDSRTFECRDDGTLDHRDSRTCHRDSRTNHRDSRTNHRDSRTWGVFKLLILKSFFG